MNEKFLSGRFTKYIAFLNCVYSVDDALQYFMVLKDIV